MRIFLTGGSGFLGRAVRDGLRDHEVLALTRDPSRLAPLPRHQVLAGDLSDASTWKPALETFRPEACLHLAWEGLPDYSLRFCQRNFEASLELFYALKEWACPRVVVTGTCFEYGTLTGCLTEDAIGEGVGLFAGFKAALRLAGARLFKDSGTSFLWSRPFFVYGPGQRPTSLLPSAYRALAAGTAPNIQTPDTINDFIHVNDVASGVIRLALGSAPTGIYNLGSGQPTRVRDAVNTLARLMQVSPPFPDADQPGKGFWADGSHTRDVADWQPRYSLEEGIRNTLDFWRASP